MDNRRSFLKKLVLGLPAGYAFPGLLASCSTQDNLFPDINYSGRVLVIGAGAAGLHATDILNSNGVDVLLLEATNQTGGRIRKLDNFTGYPLELGAERVKGKRSIFYDSIRISNQEFYELEGKDFFLIGEEFVSREDGVSNETVLEVQNAIQELRSYTGDDMPISEYLEAKGFSEEARQILNGLIGNEYGTDNDSLGIHGFRQREASASSGEGEFVMRLKSLKDILDVQYSRIADKIRLNTPIKSIDYSGGNIVVTDHANQTYEADKLIITVPLSILKAGDIQFNPTLPEEKLLAMDKLGMDPGLKIFMRFSENFWGDPTGSTTDTFYLGGLIPKFTVPGWGREHKFNDDRIFFNNVLVGVVNGSVAQSFSEIGGSAVTFALQELDEAFNGQASRFLTESFVMDWSKENFIKGAWSYPKADAGNARNVLAAPIDDRIFFAGEATHTMGHYGTVHGAMETGYRAAFEVLKSIS